MRSRLKSRKHQVVLLPFYWYMHLLRVDLIMANAILHGLPKYLIRRLQCVQNCAARLITRNSKFTQITPILKELCGPSLK